MSMYVCMYVCLTNFVHSYSLSPLHHCHEMSFWVSNATLTAVDFGQQALNITQSSKFVW